MQARSERRPRRRRAPPLGGARARAGVARRGLLLALVLVGVAGCGAAAPIERPIDASRIRFGEGSRRSARGAYASLVVPAPFERKANHAWIISQDGTAAALLTVEATDAPESGIDAWMDRRIRAVEAGGLAGVSRDERVDVGDLEARLIEAVDLIGKERKAIMMLVVEDEAHLVVATIYAPIEVMEAGRAHFEAALRSLRLRSTP